MILVTLADFVGQYSLARSNASDPILQSFITREEKKTIYKLLGQPLGDLLIAYIQANQTPVVTRYANIINSFYLPNSTLGCNFGYWSGGEWKNYQPPFFDSTGLKDLLVNAIHYAYVTETGFSHGQSGVNASKVDTAEDAGTANTFRYAEQKWNNAGFDTWLAIRWRCLVYDSATYPEFDGQIPKATYGSLF